ncbi:alpha/beta hydrolase [Mycobacterium branderi]|uniref:Peptidase n=1 Tax=Mycobacterium branderi TaxID=43348 RepID=A0A7I7WCI0_9MYCO|nr:alpha/beta hydrolase [Mycobacterium branderi]MCV7236389.1 alpha/beta fold hydrolase [Mycobacterium branderi]ORA32566.1 hypothetical protein BST20_24485 [Mycobacterium branderi]BBZ15276.1 peptidase [Mycobacterium branderi]
MAKLVRFLSRAAAVLTAAALCAVPISAEHASTPALAWRDCHTDKTSPRLQCATILVPLDWADPTSGAITLALNRIPAADPAHRIGVLITNPGGPGNSGVDDVAQEGAGPGPELDIVSQRFDIIGLDPRGVAHSTPVRCPSPIHDPGLNTFPDSEQTYALLVAANRRAGQQCSQRTGPLIGHVDTISAARDIDAVRVALGESTVSLLGESYGTELFSTYLALFGQRVRAAVLDGAVDHTRSTWQDAQDEAIATEEQFHRFTAWCTHEPTCPLGGVDIAGRFGDILARADESPRTVNGTRVDGRLITQAVYELLFRNDWPELARRLRLAFAPGEPNLIALAAGHLSPDPGEAANTAIGCHDLPSEISGLGDLQTKVRTLQQLAPLTWRYSETWAWSTSCLGWPIPSANPPAPQHIRNTSPVLVIDCTHDPATPIQWAVALAGQFERAHLVTVECDGHTAITHSAWARRHEAAFLIEP